MRNFFRAFITAVLGMFLTLGIARADLADALDLATGTPVTTSTVSPWSLQTTTTHDGVDAAQSGATAGGHESTLSLTVTGPLELSFYWKLDSFDQGAGSIAFHVDGVEQTYIQPTQDWNQRHHDIPAGPHTLSWVHNDLIGSEYSTAWLDQVVLDPIVFHPVAFNLGAHGTRIGGGELVQSVRAGRSAVAPVLAVEAGWAFTSWDLAFDAVTTELLVTARYVVSTAPQITVSPTPLSLSSGASAALSVTATGNAPLSYQWYRGETGDTSSLVPGATGPLLVTPALIATTRFWVRVTNGAGAADSAAATVTITPLAGQTLRAFGSTAFGRLGNGYPGFATLPVNVAADVKSVSAGRDRTVFLKTDGSLWGVGGNPLPVTPTLIATDVTAVSAGELHTVFLKTDGSLWTMGDNRFGQLGDGSTTSREMPLQIATGVASAAAGDYHTLFVKTDGSLWGMGHAEYGQLGDFSAATMSPTPRQIATGVASAAAARFHTLFLKTDGSLWTTGIYDHSLFDSTANDPFIPTRIATGVASVATAYSHTHFIKIDGTLWALGLNDQGQLGDGSTTDRSTPVQITTGVASVSAGAGHTVFVKTDASLWTTGANTLGQLGDGSTQGRSTPVQIASGVATATAGASHTLFVKTDATLFATGDNTQGQLGDGRAAQSQMLSVATGVTIVSAGRTHSIFTKTDASLWAMGANDLGQFGDGTTFGSSRPVAVGANVASASIGIDFSRFLKTDASLFCTRFENAHMFPDVGTPTLVQIAANVVSAAPGYSQHTLFIKPDSSLWGVGVNWEGQLGDGTTQDRATPVLIATGVASAATGGDHSAFIKTDGSLWTMGYNAYGQLGDGSITSRATPVQIATGVTFVAVGYYQTLFIKADGSLWATGYNREGQLGDGTTTDLSTPVLIANDVASVSAFGSHTLFIKTDGSLWALGDNRYGQLGDGTFTRRLTPVQVATHVTAASAGANYSLVLTPSAFVAWATAAGLSTAHAATDADPDADGVPNLLEYAFGTSPAIADSASARPSVASGTIGGQPALVLTHRRRKTAALTYTYQTSSSLANPAAWIPVVVTPMVIDPDVDGDGLVELVTVSVPLPADAEPCMFLRVSVGE